MEAIILAGGFGTRLQGVINKVPKAMAPINEIPFLEIVLKNLSKEGFKKVIISTFFKGEIISNYFGNEFQKIKLIYTNEKTPLGTGGALKYALNFVSKDIDHVFILNGDTFADIDFRLLENRWLNTNKPIIVGVKVESCKRFGQLVIENERVVGFNEKKQLDSGIINAGCYLFQKEILSEWEYDVNFSLEKDFLINNLIKKTFLCHLHEGIFIDIGIPNDYENAKILLKNLCE